MTVPLCIRQGSKRNYMIQSVWKNLTGLLPDTQAAAIEAGTILIQHPYDSALELLRAAFSAHCSSLSTGTTAHLKTPLSSSWSLQTTPHSSSSFRTVMSLLKDRRLKSWLSSAVFTTWSLTRSKLWRWSWTSGEPFCKFAHIRPEHI